MPRGLALSRDGTLGRATWSACRVPSAVSRSRAWELRSLELRRASEFIPRESCLVSCGGEYVLLCNGELCECWIANDFRRGVSRRDVALLSTLRQTRNSVCRHRSDHRNRSTFLHASTL